MTAKEFSKNYQFKGEEKGKLVVLPDEDIIELMVEYAKHVNTPTNTEKLMEEAREEYKDLNYWKKNCEDDYLHTPISVLKYITELESKVTDINKAFEVTNTNTEKLMEVAREEAQKEYTLPFIGYCDTEGDAFIKGAQFIINRLNGLKTK